MLHLARSPRTPSTPTLPRALGPAALLWALSACGSGPSRPEQPRPLAPSALLGAPIDLSTSRELDRVRELEEARSTGGGELLRLAESEDSRTRRRAVVALGRLPFPGFGEEVTEALVLRLEDPETRQAAAFALGQRADPSSAGVLAEYLNDPDPAFRSRVVEAASKLKEDANLRRAVLVALRDADLGVRIEAAVGTARWDPADEDAADVDRALLDVLRPYRIQGAGGATPVQRSATEAELVWRVLYALARRGSELGRGAFLEYAASDVPLEQLFAVRGLGRLESAPEVDDAAQHALATTTDWRVAFEAAVALGKLGDPKSVAALTDALEHHSPHVRAAAVEAIGRLGKRSGSALKAIHRGQADVSAEVRNAALTAFCRLVDPREARVELDEAAHRADAMDRYGAALAAGEVDGPKTVALLQGLVADPSQLVATQAVTSLGRLLERAQDKEPLRAILRGLLENEDNGIRSAAVGALQQAPDPADVSALIACARSAHGDISEEIVVGVLNLCGQLASSKEAREFVRRSLVDPRPFVRRTAHRVAQEDFQLELGYTEVPPEPTRPAPPLPGRDYPAWTRNPLVEVATNRGTMVFELFPAEAPVHVWNFLELAKRGEFDGTLFHRVVPDFVIQGGDYRGDGYGGRPASGVPLRSEFTPRKFVRGSLGMPRNQDPDSGGSQIFVTHRPTPHLDGLYTLFGELRAGGEVLDAIEQGDRILAVRPFGAKAR